MNARARKLRADLAAPLPVVADTLTALERRAVHHFETRARNRRAIKDAHRTLRDLLLMLDAYAKHPALIARSVADEVHRKLRRGLRLDDPKRGPT